MIPKQITNIIFEQGCIFTEEFEFKNSKKSCPSMHIRKNDKIYNDLWALEVFNSLVDKVDKNKYLKSTTLQIRLDLLDYIYKNQEVYGNIILPLYRVLTKLKPHWVHNKRDVITYEICIEVCKYIFQNMSRDEEEDCVFFKINNILTKEMYNDIEKCE